MLAVVIPSSICNEGTKEKSTTDTTMVTTIAIEVAYTCRRPCELQVLALSKRICSSVTLQ